MHFGVHFWEGLCFVLFVVLAYRPVKQAVSDHLKEYASLIAQRVKEAESLRKEAEKTFKYYTEQHQVFSTKIASSSKHTKSNIQDLKNQAAIELKKKIHAKRAIHQDKLTLQNKLQAQHVQTILLDKAMQVVYCYLSDANLSNLNRSQISQLLNSVQNKSISLH